MRGMLRRDLLETAVVVTVLFCHHINVAESCVTEFTDDIMAHMTLKKCQMRYILQHVLLPLKLLILTFASQVLLQ